MVAEKRKSPLRSTPKRKKDADLDRFAEAAGKDRDTSTMDFPWNAPHIREDVMKNLPLRLSEPLYLKLKYIAANTPYSMNSFILERIAEEVDREIERIAGKV